MLKTKEYDPARGWYTTKANFARYADPMASSMAYRNFIMNSPKNYVGIATAPDYNTALAALAQSPYATDPRYAEKVGGMVPNNETQQAFFDARYNELMQAGMPPHLARLGAQQSALETGWGKSAPGNNYYGIKGGQTMKVPHQYDMFPGEKPIGGLYDTVQTPTTVGQQCGGPGQMPCPGKGGSGWDTMGFAKAGLGFMAQDPAHKDVSQQVTLPGLLSMLSGLNNLRTPAGPGNFAALFGGK